MMFRRRPTGRVINSNPNKSQLSNQTQSNVKPKASQLPVSNNKLKSNHSRVEEKEKVKENNTFGFQFYKAPEPTTVAEIKKQTYHQMENNRKKEHIQLNQKLEVNKKQLALERHLQLGERHKQKQTQIRLQAQEELNLAQLKKIGEEQEVRLNLERQRQKR